MKRKIHYLLLLILLLNKDSDELYAQAKSSHSLVRFYVDNDFLNIRGHGTDKAYTNGMRIDLFYIKKKNPKFFIDRFVPKAGNKSINIFGWGIMQLMFTPNDISVKEYQPNDYSYSGALFVTHTVYSFNTVKKYDFQSELIMGIRGPSSFAAQTQSFVHRMIHYQKPMGWGNQLNTQLLLNYNFTAEKLLKEYGSSMEIIGGGKIMVGSMTNALSSHLLIRIGKIVPYFQGYLNQYGRGTGENTDSRIKACVIIKPQAQLVFSNSLIENNFYSTTLQKQNDDKTSDKSNNDIKRFVCNIEYGVLASIGNFGISFIQNTSSALLKKSYMHEFGNLSFYFSW